MRKIKIEKHVYLTNEQYKIINDYSIDKEISFSKAFGELIEKSNRYDTVINMMQSMSNNIEYISKKSFVTLRLLEQLYSDLEFTSITDINKSDALRLFKRMLRNGKYNGINLS